MQKILINGAGLAGLTTALSLADYVSEIIIIEPQTEEKYTKIIGLDFRTTALSAFTKNFYNKIGFWNNIQPVAGGIEDIKIIDSDFVSGDSALKLAFKSSDISDEPMGYILENSDLKGKLYEAAQKHKNIKILFDTKVKSFENKPNNIEFEIESGENNTQKFTVNLALATDGKNSYLRQLCGVKVKERDYHQTAITFNISHEEPHNGTAIEKFMPSGPFAVLPMKNPNQSAIVWSIEGEAINAIKSLDDAGFYELVAQRFCDYFGSFKIISDKNYYPLTLKFSKQYYSGRIVFIGDAIHGIHPIAGQGFNLGVKDIAEITEIIKHQIALGLDIGSESLLQEYQKKRLYQNMQMIGATEVFNAVFSNDNKTLTKARRVGIATINKLKPIKNFFVKKAMGF